MCIQVGSICSPPLECFLNHIPFSRRCGTARCSGIQLETARYGYSWIQWDTAGYSGSAAKWLDTGIRRDTKDTEKYRQDTGEIQKGYPKNTRQGRAILSQIFTAAKFRSTVGRIRVNPNIL